MDLGLSGKSVLITGASKGIGCATAWAFAVNGAASVIGSAGVLWIAFAHGFPAALLTAGVLYVAAFVLLGRRTAWERVGTH